MGETLAGTVGGWKDATTDFKRRWVRCDAGRHRLHLHPEGRERRPGDRVDLRRARGRPRLHAAPACRGGRQQRPHAGRAGQPSAALGRGRHTGVGGRDLPSVPAGVPGPARGWDPHRPSRRRWRCRAGHGEAGDLRAAADQEALRRRQRDDLPVAPVRAWFGAGRHHPADARTQGGEDVPARRPARTAGRRRARSRRRSPRSAGATRRPATSRSRSAGRSASASCDRAPTRRRSSSPTRRATSRRRRRSCSRSCAGDANVRSYLALRLVQCR